MDAQYDVTQEWLNRVKIARKGLRGTKRRWRPSNGLWTEVPWLRWRREYWVLALSWWTNQLWRVITCWCISTVTWSHDLNSYMVIWYKSHGLICVCFKRWDKDVCDPYEATPWWNHTWDTNYSRSLLNYILFNLSIGIVVLSREIQIEGWCLPKLKHLYSKAIFEKQKSLERSTVDCS
jgi:hypothetical protein